KEMMRLTTIGMAYGNAPARLLRVGEPPSPLHSRGRRAERGPAVGQSADQKAGDRARRSAVPSHEAPRGSDRGGQDVPAACASSAAARGRGTTRGAGAVGAATRNARGGRSAQCGHASAAARSGGVLEPPPGHRAGVPRGGVTHAAGSARTGRARYGGG